jgi:hypothetical protein
VAEERRRRIRRTRQEAAHDHDDHEGHDHEGHDHDDHDGHDHEGHDHDGPTADDVEELAEVDAAGREPISAVRAVEEESAGTQQAETLADHEDEAEVTIEDELPGDESTAAADDDEATDMDDK